MRGTFEVVDEAAMQALAERFAETLEKPAVIALHGDLGAGKSVFARALIRSLGHRGAVKSPTYTLVEQYKVPGWRIAHFDLYRLSDPEELQFIGFRELVVDSDLILIEWPNNGADYLPDITATVNIDYQPVGRLVKIS